MKNLMVILLTATSVLIACSKDNGESAPNPDTATPSTTKSTSTDNLHCRLAYDHSVNDVKNIKTPEKRAPLSYVADDVGTLEFEDEYYSLSISYRSEQDTSNLKDTGSNTGKIVDLGILFQDNKKALPPVTIHTQISMGWNMWQFPIDLTINGDNYNRATITCGFFNN